MFYTFVLLFFMFINKSFCPVGHQNSVMLCCIYLGGRYHKITIMGSNDSKMAAAIKPETAIKPEPPIKKTHISHLIDPRSPSTGIDRTPIQVGYLVGWEKQNKTLENVGVFNEAMQNFYFELEVL